MGTFYDSEVERQKKDGATVNTILPILAALETIVTAKATRGQNVGTSTLGLIKDTHSRRADALDRAQKSDNDAFTKNLHIGEAARASKRYALDEAQGKREASRYDREIVEAGEKENTRKATIDRLLGIPNEYDESTNTVTRSGVPGAQGLTVEDKAAIQIDPLGWLSAKLKPQATQLVLGNDGTYQALNKATALTPEGNRVTAPPPKETKAPKTLEEITAEAAARAKGTAEGAGPKAEKPPTEDMTKAATFARRMELAENDLQELTTAGYDPTTAANAAKSSKWTPNMFNSSEGQRYSNAEQNFATANLRKESGAVIGDDEMARQERLYFPRHGDSPETVKQKARNRAQAYEGMKAGAGAQFDKVPSMIPVKAPAASNPVIDELKRRAQAGDATAQAGLKAKGITW